MKDDSEQPRLELNAETGAAATLDIYAEARRDFDGASAWGIIPRNGKII